MQRNAGYIVKIIVKLKCHELGILKSFSELSILNMFQVGSLKFWGILILTK